ncbi:speckle-type poz protein [Culex quinquefasciatus]|uniref:Centrosomal protein of 162 kDa n=1 Tax=Culex quinquefasciatus TaxID=7176 RepID=B0WQK5_CULQU|nr:speckle-type poz protein [Culex quinquefasciatus]|eukprot:XP_001850989.1 speckle-type poz protein [Culex quinquefasciatus]
MVESTENKVTITDIEPKVFEQLLRFMYTDSVADSDMATMAFELLQAADKYDLETLKTRCEAALCGQISKETAVNTLVLADLYHAKKLKRAAINFIGRNVGHHKPSPARTATYDANDENDEDDDDDDDRTLEEETSAPSPVRDQTRRRSFVISSHPDDELDDGQPDLRPDCDQTYTLPPVVPASSDEMRTKRPSSGVAPNVVKAPPSKATTTPKKRNSLSKGSGQPPRKATEDNKENQSRIRDLEQIYNLTLNEPAAASPRRTKSPARKFCDKSTAPSPTHSGPLNDSWAKERELELSITELQEKLKDTEERYESLKIQYDTLSQVHRALRETHGSIQDESDRLKLDVQHLTECANVLRAELQSARSDRDAALELQKILQSELEESRRDRKRYQELNEKDTRTIQDLQRQCREMERILMRKHPDSVSALIVASKNTTNSAQQQESSSSQTRRLLEQRIAQLEADAKEQDAKAQGILANVQARFNSVQAKYETHIADLEMQVLSLQEINSKLNEKIIRQMEELSSITSHAATSLTAASAAAQAHVATSSCFTQTEELPERECHSSGTKTRSISVQTDSKLTAGTGRAGGAGQQQPKRAASASAAAASSSKQLPNSLSDSQIQSREDAHLLATIRGMRVDLAIKEKAVQRLTREVEDCKRTIRKLQKERDSYLKPEGGKPAVKSGKAYDPAQFADGGDGGGGGGSALKDANLKIRLLEADYKTLHDKRLQDLKTLQAAHERELAACHETVRIMQQRLADREDHLQQQQQHQTKEKRRPNHNVDYYALKAKVTSLERRHTEREQRLHMLVEALSKGGKLNGVHIRQLASTSSSGGGGGIDEDPHNLASIHQHQHQNATVGGNL